MDQRRLAVLLTVMLGLVEGKAEEVESVSAEAVRFSYSASGLIPMTPEPPDVSTPAATDLVATTVGEELELSLHSVSRDYSLEASVQQFEGLNGSPVLIVPEPKEERGGAAGWVQREVLEPALSMEVVKVRKVALTGSIITAVKRKNPLYLLNPLVFAASW